MNLTHAILADAAQASPDGKYHLLGGGISIWWADEVPVTIRLALVLGFEYSAVEAGRQRQIEVELTNADGSADGLPKITTAVGLAGRGPGMPVGAPLMTNGIINYITDLPAHGTYAFQILLDGNHVGTAPLVVARRPQELAQAS
jgi:Family of unknown function (DUF6941)